MSEHSEISVVSKTGKSSSSKTDRYLILAPAKSGYDKVALRRLYELNQKNRGLRGLPIGKRSLGKVICPVCQRQGRLRADNRNRTTVYEVVHHDPETKRYPNFGKYRSSCYLGKAGSFDVDMVERVKK